MSELNKLCGTRAYLCGAIDRDPAFGHGWRGDISNWLQSRGIVVLNPLEKPIDIGIENTENVLERRQWKLDGEFDRVAQHMRAIRVTDLRMVDMSDFLIVNIDISVHATGTYEELFWSNRMKHPTLVRIEQGKSHAPDWLLGTVPPEHIFSAWDELKDYLDGVDSGRDTQSFKRWMFFDLGKPTLKALLKAAENDNELKDMILNWSDKYYSNTNCCGW